MESLGGTYIACTMASPAIDNPIVKTIRIVAFTILGREFSLGAGAPVFPIVSEDVDFAAEFVVRAERLLERDEIKPIQETARQGGLPAIVDGLLDLKSGNVSRSRLVYSLN